MIWDFISERMLQYDSAWISDTVDTYSYSKVVQKAVECGENLKKNFKANLKIGVLCSNSINEAIAILGCWYAHKIPVPMSLNYGDRHCEKIIKTTKLEIVITDDFVITSKYNICSYNICNHKIEGQIKKIEEIEYLRDVILIMNTSGTTGNPKGVMITEEGLIKNILGINDYFKIGKGDRILIARPLYHCAVLTGEFLISLFKGINIVFFNGMYNPALVIKYIESMQISVMCGTPTLFRHLAMLCKRMHAGNSIKTIALSGECLNKEIASQIRMVFFNAEIYNVYGLTEVSPRVSYLPPNLFDTIPESVGIGLKNTIIAITDDEGNHLAAYEHGNIIISSPSIMKGYYKNKDLTESRMKNGYLLTGDVGYLDDKGNLYVLSRYDDMIIKAGMNIYPKEIENVLDKLPMIMESVVYGVSENGSQSIAMDIVLHKNCKCGKKELMVELSNVLPSYQLPTYINIVSSLRRNASGKIIRNHEIKLENNRF